SADGQYAVEIGTGVQDLSGNRLTSPFQQSFVIDNTGPRVTAIVPIGTVNSTAESVDVTFSEPIVLSTFNANDITLVDPLGRAIGISAISFVVGNTYRLSFASQNTNGTYNLSIGPEIEDTAGNTLDQNSDGVSGDPTLDVFHASFTIALPA